MAFNISYLEQEILDQYLYDENSTRPWIIGFSGGKDSTMLLQLVWKALLKIDPFLRNRKIYVVSNDTLVENPKIVDFIEKTLSKIQEAAIQQQMPIVVLKTRPQLEDSFWVKLIGLGYPAPNQFYRWCTERLKINPTTKVILDKISENGEAIILLGTRIDESSRRAASIKKHSIRRNRLSRHNLHNAYTYTPLKHVTTNDVWLYLNQVPPPWGGTHKELVTLYRNANSGDCPLVIDKTTPSCGNSRFGCWVCTVVNKDKSMEALIDNGEDWMLPLMEIRNFLVETRDNPEIYREKRRRNGTETEGMWGPYKFETRVEILKRVLEAQKEIRLTQEIELITNQELVLIQYHWLRDCFFGVKVSDIYNALYKEEFEVGRQEAKIQEELNLLRNVCKDDGDDFTLIQDLLALQRTKLLLIRKKGLQNDIENRIEQHLKSKNRV